jgi:hypothetical protein
MLIKKELCLLVSAVFLDTNCVAMASSRHSSRHVLVPHNQW